MRMHWHAPRRLRSGVLLLVLGAVVLAVAIAMAAEKPRLESAWTAEAPEIDGKLTDWPSPLVTLGSVPLSMGMGNDGQFVYVALAASDQPTRMMLAAAGFTVWCDPAGKEKKSFGIMVPAVMAGGPGMRGRGPSGGPPGQGGQPPDWQGMPPQGRGDPPDQAGPPAQGQEGQDPKPKGGPAGAAVQPIRHIEVAGAKKDDRRRLELEYARTIGLDAVARVAEGVLVYEIRIPLSASEAQPYAVRSTPGVTIGVGVESAELQGPGGRGEEGGPGRGGMGGGAPGGGGGRGGGIGGMGGGSRGGMGGSPTGGGREGTRGMKPIKVWTTVHLAKAPA